MANKNRTLSKGLLNYSLKVIDRWLGYKQFHDRIPGLCVGIVFKNDLVFKKGYGYANVEAKVSVNPDTNFRIASISKVFTATSLLQLYEAGKLSLDDRVAKYLEWFGSDKDKKLEAITIRELLTHSSGISRDGRTHHWDSDIYPDLNELIDAIKRGTTVQEPASRFKYSNLGYSILGEVVQRVSGKPYNKYVSQSILKKIGMQRTYTDLNDTGQNQATGYGRDIPNKNREIFKPCNTKAMSPATGLVSNVSDLAKFISAQFVGSGKLLSDQSKREMQRINWTRKTTGDHYGLGYETWYLGKKLLVGHGGGFPGFKTKIGLDIEDQVGVIILTNSIDAKPSDLMNGIFNTISKIEEVKGTVGPFKNSLSKYEGKYVCRWGETDIISLGDKLVGFSPDEDNPLRCMSTLIPSRANVFKIESKEDFEYYGESAKFILDATGNIIGVNWGPNYLERSK